MYIPIQELIRKYGITPTGVIHIGANVGEEAFSYNQAGVKDVVWIEADVQLLRALTMNVSSYPGSIVINECVGCEDGKMCMFHISSNNGQSSSLLNFGTHRYEHPEVSFIGDALVKLKRMDTIVNEYGIDITKYNFLNIDLQGSELNALKSFGDMLSQFKYLYIEVNDAELYVGCPMVAEIDEYVSGFGFVPIECFMTRHKWGDKFYSKLTR